MPWRWMLGVTAVLLVAWLGQRWWWARSHISSNNAQVQGHIVPVLPKVGGYVAEVRVREHQRVEAGELLVRIDEREYRAQLAKAEAGLQLALAEAGSDGRIGQAVAQFAASKAASAAAGSAVELALAEDERAQKDLERMRALHAQGSVAGQRLDAAHSDARIAKARVQASRSSALGAREQALAANAALRGAQARVDSARAVRDLAAQQLADTRIVAPVSGYASELGVEPGALLRPGQPLLAVVPLDDTWVMANLKETQLADVDPGDAVDIEVDAYPGLKLKGTVESISPATGARFSLLPPDNATGNFTKVVQRVPVKISVQQPDPLRPLRPGMSVDVVIATTAAGEVQPPAAQASAAQPLAAEAGSGPPVALTPH
jgi:membrane fusion protein (multidrug efflux system)